MSVELISDRLVLRILGEEDVTHRYVDWLNDPKVNQYLEVRHVPQDLDSVKAFVADCARNGVDYLFGVFEKSGLRHIGNIKVGPVDVENATSEIGLLIGEVSAWGKGYGKEMISSVCDFAFNQLGLERLHAGYYAPNEGSAKAFAKSGFVVDRVLKDHAKMDGITVDVVRVSLSKDDY